METFDEMNKQVPRVTKLNKDGVNFFKKRRNNDCEHWLITGLDQGNFVFFHDETLKVLFITQAPVYYHRYEIKINLTIGDLYRMVKEYNGKDIFVDYNY